MLKRQRYGKSPIYIGSLQNTFLLYIIISTFGKLLKVVKT